MLCVRRCRRIQRRLQWYRVSCSRQQRRSDADGQNPTDHGQRNLVGNGIVMNQHHLDSHIRQQEHQAHLQIAKLVHQSRDRKIQRSQPQDGKDVGGEYQERISSHCKDGGDAIQSKHHIRSFNHHQCQGRMRYGSATIWHSHQKRMTGQIVRSWIEAIDQANQ